MEIVHSRWLTELAGLFPDTCTIQRPAQTNVKGDIIDAPWVNVAGLVDMACRVSPAGVGTEIRTSDQTYEVTTHTITLRGRYDGIEPQMRAVVSGVYYDIQAVTGDGCGVMTRISARILT